MPTSRLGGVPTVLPSPADAAAAVAAGAAAAIAVGQLRLELEPVPSSTADELDPPAGHTSRPLPDVVHVSHWLSAARQQALVDQFRQWAVPPAGLRHPRVPAGHLMTVQSVCLGWHWQPYRYSRTADDTDGAPVKPLPGDLIALACRAVADTGLSTLSSAPFDPDAAIVNYYQPGARLGLHQDGEEPSDAPVVTVSLGDTCTFRMAGVDRRTSPFTDIELRSGDLLVFGGRNRRVYHGVPKVLDGTAPAGLGLPPGRLSITIRQTGL